MWTKNQFKKLKRKLVVVVLCLFSIKKNILKYNLRKGNKTPKARIKVKSEKMEKC